MYPEYPSTMKYSHLYQSLVADNHPALHLVDRAEAEGMQQAAEEYAAQVGLDDWWEFDDWVESKCNMQQKSQKLFDSEKHYEWFLCVNGDNDARSLQAILDHMEHCKGEQEIAEFLLEAIKILHELRV